MNAKTILYWASNAILVFCFASGGIAELMHWEGSALGMRLIGYPDYLMSILGFWKELGCVALLVPGLGRLKEWAYAGMFFEVTGAAASHWAMADYGAGAYHILVNLFLAAMVIVSWASRPESRIVGALFGGQRLDRPAAGAPANLNPGRP
jgi:hypothetical protein